MHMRARLCVCVGQSQERAQSRETVERFVRRGKCVVGYFFLFSIREITRTYVLIYIFLSKSKESKAEKLFDQSSNFHEIIKYKVSPCLHEISLRRGVDWPRIYIYRYPVGYMQA